MMIPSMVRKLRSRCAFSARTAMPKASASWPAADLSWASGVGRRASMAGERCVAPGASGPGALR